ncbi:MAG: hypothetical protein CTY19_17705 [Methylomonas sp.]|nr:MAG: hypothetical protein CTY19_17705 [Methylomonas sp.]
MINVIRAESGWRVINAIKTSQNQPNTTQYFEVKNYPLIAWQIENEKPTPVTPIGILKNVFVATISPNGEIYSNCTNKRVFQSVEDWLSDILTTYAGRL